MQAKSNQRRELVADGPVPLYEQITRVLLSEVLANRTGPRRLGSDNALMARFGVSRMTIRSAVDELVRQGLVQRIQGKGTYVVDPRSVEVRLDGLERFLQEWHEPHLHTHARILSFRTIAATASIAQTLRSAPGSRVLHVRRLREADEGPIVIDDRYVPAWCMHGLTREDAAKQSLFVSIESHSGIRTETVEQTISAVLANDAEAKLLEVSPGTSVLERRVVFMTADLRPTLCGRSIYRGDRVQFQLRASRSAGLP
ncbi:MAG: GntR family transcriptional regulator [Vulcanimicrobiaceae bacterium]